VPAGWGDFLVKPPDSNLQFVVGVGYRNLCHGLRSGMTWDARGHTGSAPGMMPGMFPFPCIVPLSIRRTGSGALFTLHATAIQTSQDRRTHDRSTVRSCRSPASQAFLAATRSHSYLLYGSPTARHGPIAAGVRQKYKYDLGMELPGSNGLARSRSRRVR
jgi:hypothetical protein